MKLTHYKISCATITQDQLTNLPTYTSYFSAKTDDATNILDIDISTNGENLSDTETAVFPVHDAVPLPAVPAKDADLGGLLDEAEERSKLETVDELEGKAASEFSNFPAAH